MESEAVKPTESELADQEYQPRSMPSRDIEVATIGCMLAALGLLLSWGLYLPVGAFYGGTAIDALVGAASLPLFSPDWLIIFTAVLGIILSLGIVIVSRARTPRRWTLLALTLCSATTLLILLLLPALTYVDRLQSFTTFNAPGYLLSVLGMLTFLCVATMALRSGSTMSPDGEVSAVGASDLGRLKLAQVIGSVTAVIGAYVYVSQYEKVILGPRNPPSQTFRTEWLQVYMPEYRIAYGLWLLFALAALATALVSLKWRGTRPLLVHGIIALAGCVAALVVLLLSVAPTDLIPTILSVRFESIGLLGFMTALLADALLLRALRKSSALPISDKTIA
jgi:hypothetical protein